jgi:endonuclease III
MAPDCMSSLACDIVRDFDGDGQQIWLGRTPAEAAAQFNRLRFGPQITNMTIGALEDTGQIEGIGDVKADLHVRRVLGRVLSRGSTLSEKRAIGVARELNPENPWLLDLPLFDLGRSICTARNTACEDCYLVDVCGSAYASR